MHLCEPGRDGREPGGEQWTCGEGGREAGERREKGAGEEKVKCSLEETGEKGGREEKVN